MERSIKQCSGSFRDPDSFAFESDGQFFRSLSSDQSALLSKIKGGENCSVNIRERLLDFRFVDGEMRKLFSHEFPEYESFISVDTVWPIVYPYEWTAGMLADAALCTIDLQRQLLSIACSLKDASAFNIQFARGKPFLMDLGSIENPKRRDIWYALGQFNRMFLFPLMLCRYFHWDLSSCFLPFPEGIDVERMASLIGRSRLWHPRYIVDLGLPLLLGRYAHKLALKQEGGAKEGIASSGAQLMMLKRLARKVRSCSKSSKSVSVWSDYTKTCLYDESAERCKKYLAKEFLAAVNPKRVLDLGCNTGDYSYIAASSGAQVLAVDSDVRAVEVMYERLKKGPADITPAVVDTLNPSPALGIRNLERPSFIQRAKADCVMALAIMHHLLVNGKMGLSGLRDMLMELTSDAIILEAVPADDPMFRRITEFRKDTFDDITVDAIRSTFGATMTIEAVKEIAGTKRVLMLLRRRK